MQGWAGGKGGWAGGCWRTLPCGGSAAGGVCGRLCPLRLPAGPPRQPSLANPPKLHPNRKPVCSVRSGSSRGQLLPLPPAPAHGPVLSQPSPGLKAACCGTPWTAPGPTALSSPRPAPALGDVVSQIIPGRCPSRQQLAPRGAGGADTGQVGSALRSCWREAPGWVVPAGELGDQQGSHRQAAGRSALLCSCGRRLHRLSRPCERRSPGLGARTRPALPLVPDSAACCVPATEPGAVSSPWLAGPPLAPARPSPRQRRWRAWPSCGAAAGAAADRPPFLRAGGSRTSSVSCSGRPTRTRTTSSPSTSSCTCWASC